MEKYNHIGLHKTGTTYLQKRIFKNIQNFNYVQNGKIKHFVGEGDKLLISNEAFSGVPYNRNSKNYFEQFRENFQKLKSIFGKFKVIIGYREPSSIINSLYKQHLHEGGTCEFDQFYNASGDSIIGFEDLKFYKFYSYLKEEIGKENIFGYVQSELLNNEQSVLIRLEKFLDESILRVSKSDSNNISVPGNLESILLTLNRIDQELIEHGIISLNNRLFKRVGLAPRILCQRVLPRISSNRQVRDLSGLKEVYSEDWNRLKTELDF